MKDEGWSSVLDLLEGKIGESESVIYRTLERPFYCIHIPNVHVRVLPLCTKVLLNPGTVLENNC